MNVANRCWSPSITIVALRVTLLCSRMCHAVLLAIASVTSFTMLLRVRHVRLVYKNPSQSHMTKTIRPLHRLWQSEGNRMSTKLYRLKFVFARAIACAAFTRMASTSHNSNAAAKPAASTHRITPLRDAITGRSAPQALKSELSEFVQQQNVTSPRVLIALFAELQDFAW